MIVKIVNTVIAKQQYVAALSLYACQLRHLVSIQHKHHYASATALTLSLIFIFFCLADQSQWGRVYNVFKSTIRSITHFLYEGVERSITVTKLDIHSPCQLMTV